MTDIDKLLSIMTQLRDPESGCPWDKQQDFASIAPYTIEEAYEVQQAILDDDRAALREELGDLLLQVVYHAEMARERGWFAFQDVVDAISDKMIRRHPHVFGDQQLDDVKAVKQSWEAIKRAENVNKPKPAASRFDDIPLTLPALKRAQSLQEKAVDCGFDWQSIDPVFDKIAEETEELKNAIENRHGQAAVSAELGDLFFSVVNLARHLQMDGEFALQRANHKFLQRFQFIESELGKQSRSVDDCSLSELECLWQAAKQAGL